MSDASVNMGIARRHTHPHVQCSYRGLLPKFVNYEWTYRKDKFPHLTFSE